MDYIHSDFFGADDYFSDQGQRDWSEIDKLLNNLTLQLQPSDEAGISGSPIFDPKAINSHLTSNAAAMGWNSIPVPRDLRAAFGKDWDAGKRYTLVEWQFSNYPFLWNNIIRSHVVCANRTLLAGMGVPRCLIVVTKSSCLPASKSTLYYEQALSQMDVVLRSLELDVAIRLVGLRIPPGVSEVQADWNEYKGRTSRTLISSKRRPFSVSWEENQRRTPFARLHPQ